jgi:integrating conjugative element membrane protein (TIGR03747 family)
VFEKTGLIEWINYSAAQSRINGSQAQGVHQYLGLMYVYVEDYGLAALYTVLTFLTRLLILTLSIPLFLMAAFTSAVDGLVRRDLRRFGAGRESGFIYHRAKMLVVPVGVAPWVVYLALPVSVSPVLILLPCAVVLGGVMSVAVGSFKKYL